MDFSAISSAVKTIGGLLTTEVASLWGVKDQVEDLQRELTWMQSFLKKAAARKVDAHVAEIRELAYDAEDVIETFALKVAPRRRGGISNVIKRSACILNEGWLLYQNKCEIERITARITKLTRRLQTYKLDDDKSRDEAGSSRSNQRQELRRPYPHIPDDNAVGLADDIKTLVPVLIDQESECRVVSICGMGGQGKTTLAKRIYHHSRVIGHFNRMAFVYVSQQCQKRKVWEDILSGLKILEDADKKRRDEELADKLYNFLKDNRCLVILDDIWSTEDWDLLKPALPVEGDVKSKFLVTSRHKEVVSHADRRGHLHELQCLNDEESWELFQKIAFPQTGRMEELGKEMIHHCAGLPLAITVVGGVLATKTSVYEWQMVLENFNSYLKKRGKGLSTMDVLALSFDDLPPYLRPCFLYLSVFPEDYEIPAERLIQLWVTEGLVSSEEDKGEIMEDVAEHMLVELVERCMLQVGRRSPILKIETCRMHDLMRELCLSIAEKEKFVCTIGDPSFPLPLSRVVRRIVVHQPVVLRRIESSPVRSILFFHDTFRVDALSESFLLPKMLKYIEEHEHDYEGCTCSLGLLRDFLYWKLQVRWSHLFNNYKFLRVLYFDESHRSIPLKTPSAIGNLIHLRFLNLGESGFLISRIPTSLGNLRCLQTLDFRISTGLFYPIYVPDVIWKLEQLRHLYLPDNMDEKTKLRLHTLRNLQTLENFSTKNCFAIDLSKLTNLRKLKIFGALDMEDFKECLDKNQAIITGKYLQSLSIFTGGKGIIDAQVLGHLLSSCGVLCELMLQGKMKMLPAYHHFPSTIAYIRLKFCKLEEDPMPTLEKLPNLRILVLDELAFIAKKMVCSAPHFPRLESLIIHRHYRFLEEWEVEEGAMPALCRLEIIGCRSLKMLPDGLRFITTLQELRIEEMPMEFQDRMVEGGEDFYKVQHVPCIVFSRMY
ncbi:hypothetical protein V6N13_085605 [Hibiscus sabdariffa]